MDDGWVLRPEAEAAELAQKWYGLAGEELAQLRAYLVDHNENAISAATWFLLEGMGVVGPSGALMADVTAIFWRQGP